MDLLSSFVTRFLCRVIESEWKWLCIRRPQMLLSSLILLDDESKYILRPFPVGGSLHVELTKACAQSWP